MTKIIIVILIILACTGTAAAQSNDSIRDTSKAVYVVDTFRVDAGILIAKDGTGFIPFRNITADQLQYVMELIAYFEKGNLLKKLLQNK